MANYFVDGLNEIELAAKMSTMPSHPYNLDNPSLNYSDYYKHTIRALNPASETDCKNRPLYRRAAPHERKTDLSTRDGRLWVRLKYNDLPQL